MNMRTLASSALLAFSTLVAAAGAENEQELYQRQYQYAHLMMRLNGLDGAVAPAELAKLKVVRPDAAMREMRMQPPSQREFLLDTFADAAEHALKTRRAKGKLSKQWLIEEPYPT